MKEKVQHNVCLQLSSLLLLITCCTCFSLHAENTNPKLPVVQVPVFKKDSFNITKYGAVADGRTLNAKQINAAIDACNKKGGGVVVIPSGLWLSGPVVIKSNVNLHLQKNALLLF